MAEKNNSHGALSQRGLLAMSIEHKGLSCLRNRRPSSEPSVYADVVGIADGKEFAEFWQELATMRHQKKFSVWRIPIRFGKCNSFRIQLNGVG